MYNETSLCIALGFDPRFSFCSLKRGESHLAYALRLLKKRNGDFAQSRKSRKATVLKVKREPPQSAQIFAAHATPSDV
jgi:hypothetical protein